MDVDAYTRRADEQPTVIVFACLKPLQPDALQYELPWRAVDLLRSWGARLILVTASAADAVRQMQRELHMTEAFICEGGAALHVPRCYRGTQSSNGADGEWETFRFNPPDKAAAVTMLRDVLVGLGRQDVLTIGIGCDLDDYGVLSTVEVPVVVRDVVKDQSGLLRYVPGAYLTNATGPNGWAEALIGP